MMKPFDLKKALAGEPVIVDGTTYVFEKLVPKDLRATPALQFRIPNTCAIFVSDLDGKSTATELQLSMAPKRTTVWVNLYDNGEKLTTSRRAHLSKTEG